MGHAALARTARAHAIRAALLTWLALTAVLAATWAAPYAWLDLLLPFEGWTAVPVAGAVAALVVVFFPIERLADRVVRDLLGHQAEGRLRNVAEEVAIALGEPPGRVLVHDSPIPNVGAFPSSKGGVVLATAGAVEQLRRDELEALVAAQLAGMRDRWCRVATRAELVWGLTRWLGLASVLCAPPLGVFVAVAMLVSPRVVEVTRDLCADVAAVDTTRHPAALAGGMRHLAPAAGSSSKQRLVSTWWLPANPFLVLPKRVESTTSISVMGKPKRSWTEDEEVAAELELRADRAAALADGADPRRYTGREYRKRWGQLGVTTKATPDPQR